MPGAAWILSSTPMSRPHDLIGSRPRYFFGRLYTGDADPLVSRLHLPAYRPLGPDWEYAIQYRPFERGAADT